MPNNTVPAFIIAAAILATAWVARPTHSVESFLNQLEEATHKKDSDGKTQLARIAEGLSKSVSSGFSAGSSGNDHTKEELAARDTLSVRDLKLVSTQSKNLERLIGVVKNEGKETLSDVRLNVMFQDAEGHLMDVAASFASVQGVLKPGQELGFSVDHTLGDYNEKPDVLASRKASSAKVSISGLRIVK